MSTRIAVVLALLMAVPVLSASQPITYVTKKEFDAAMSNVVSTVVTAALVQVTKTTNMQYAAKAGWAYDARHATNSDIAEYARTSSVAMTSVTSSNSHNADRATYATQAGTSYMAQVAVVALDSVGIAAVSNMVVGLTNSYVGQTNNILTSPTFVGYDDCVYVSYSSNFYHSLNYFVGLYRYLSPGVYSNWNSACTIRLTDQWELWPARDSDIYDVMMTNSLLAGTYFDLYGGNDANTAMVFFVSPSQVASLYDIELSSKSSSNYTDKAILGLVTGVMPRAGYANSAGIAGRATNAIYSSQSAYSTNSGYSQYASTAGTCENGARYLRQWQIGYPESPIYAKDITNAAVKDAKQWDLYAMENYKIGHAWTSDYSIVALNALSADHALNADYASSAANAIKSDYLDGWHGAGGVVYADEITNAAVLDAISRIPAVADWSSNSYHALTTDYSVVAGNAHNASTADYAIGATEAWHSLTSDYATAAGDVNNSVFSRTSDYASAGPFVRLIGDVMTSNLYLQASNKVVNLFATNVISYGGSAFGSSMPTNWVMQQYTTNGYPVWQAGPHYMFWLTSYGKYVINTGFATMAGLMYSDNVGVWPTGTYTTAVPGAPYSGSIYASNMYITTNVFITVWSNRYATMSDVDAIPQLTPTPFYTTYDWINMHGSPGVISGGELTMPVPNTIMVSNGMGMLHTSYIDYGTSGVQNTKWFTWTNSSFALPVGTSVYMYMNYDAVQPYISMHTNHVECTFLRWEMFRFYLEHSGSVPYSVKSYLHLGHLSFREHERLQEKYGLTYGSGLDILAPNNYIDCTAGSAYYGTTRRVIPASSSSTIGMDLYYKTNGFWVEVSTNKIDTLRFSTNAASLATSSNGTYTVLWLYGSANNKASVQYGEAQYSSLLEAQQASRPAPPSYFNEFCLYIGKIIVTNGSTTGYADMQYAWEQQSSSVGSGGQGGGGVGATSDYAYSSLTAQYARTASTSDYAYSSLTAQYAHAAGSFIGDEFCVTNSYNESARAALITPPSPSGAGGYLLLGAAGISNVLAFNMARTRLGVYDTVFGNLSDIELRSLYSVSIFATTTASSVELRGSPNLGDSGFINFNSRNAAYSLRGREGEGIGFFTNTYPFGWITGDLARVSAASPVQPYNVTTREYTDNAYFRRTGGVVNGSIMLGTNDVNNQFIKLVRTQDGIDYVFTNSLTFTGDPRYGAGSELMTGVYYFSTFYENGYPTYSRGVLTAHYTGGYWFVTAASDPWDIGQKADTAGPGGLAGTYTAYGAMYMNSGTMTYRSGTTNYLYYARTNFYLSTAGGTMLGGLTGTFIKASTAIFDNVTIDTANITNLNVVNLNVTNLAVIATNMILEGRLDMTGNGIYNVKDPTNASMAATRGYIDSNVFIRGANNYSDGGLIFITNAIGIVTPIRITYDRSISDTNIGLTVVDGHPLIKFNHGQNNACAIGVVTGVFGVFAQAPNGSVVGILTNIAVANPLKAQDAATKGYVDSATSVNTNFTFAEMYRTNGTEVLDVAAQYTWTNITSWITNGHKSSDVLVNPTNMTVNTAGIAIIRISASFTPSNNADDWQIGLFKNGALLNDAINDFRYSFNGSMSHVSINCIEPVASNDVFSVKVRATSSAGGTLTFVSGQFTLHSLR